MNMVDYHVTSLVRVFDEIRALAAKVGVEVAGCEIVGLVPLDPLVYAGGAYLRLFNFHPSLILVTRLW